MINQNTIDYKKCLSILKTHNNEKDDEKTKMTPKQMLNSFKTYSDVHFTLNNMTNCIIDKNNNESYSTNNFLIVNNS